MRDGLILANSKFLLHLSIRSINNHDPGWLTRSCTLPCIYTRPQESQNPARDGWRGDGREGEERRLLGDHWQAGHVTGDDWHWYRMQSYNRTHTIITYSFIWCNFTTKSIFLLLFDMINAC